jgi:uncharacterized tellurite resistance protein B-like protein
MLSLLKTLFHQMLQEGSDAGEVGSSAMHLAMASLLCEVANADYQLDPREETARVHLLSSLLGMDNQSATALLEKAHLNSKNAVSLFDFTNQLRALTSAERYSLIEAMWQVAYADGTINPQEEAVIRQVSDLIYVEHAEFIRAKLYAQALSASS